MQSEIDGELQHVDEPLRSLIKQRDAEVKEELEEWKTEQEKLEEQEQEARSKLVEGFHDEGIDLEALWEIEDEISEGFEEEVEEEIQERSRSEIQELTDEPSSLLGTMVFSDQINKLKPYYTKFYSEKHDLIDYSKNPNAVFKLWRYCIGSGVQIKSNDCERRNFIDRWFKFTPNKSGYYIFHIYQKYDGSLTAKKKKSHAPNNRHARAAIWGNAVATIDGGAKQKMKWKVGEKVAHDYARSDTEIYDNYLDHRPFTVVMTKGKEATIRVTQEFYVNARSKGSYAKVDFAHGGGSYKVGSPTIIVTPPPL